MKRKTIIMTLVMLIILSLSACRSEKNISENANANIQKMNADNTANSDVGKEMKNNVSGIKEQSNVPYLGDEEILPLFKERNNIREWLKDIKAKDVDYIFYIENETGKVRLDVRNLREPHFKYNIASFYVEENMYANFRNNQEDCVFKILPDEIMNLKIIEVIHLDFENMGIHFNVRDIVKGSSVDDVKRAFLNMNYEIDHTGVTHQKLYAIEDVYPNKKINPRYKDYIFIGGIDSLTMEQRGFREITYYHTEFYDSDNADYANRYVHSSIYFSIDTNNDKVVGLTYDKIEGFTDEKVIE